MSTVSKAFMTDTLSLEAFLPYRLSYTSEVVSAAVASVYASLFGLTIAEWRVMAVVGEGDGSTQQAIVARTAWGAIHDSTRGRRGGEAGRECYCGCAPQRAMPRQPASAEKCETARRS